MKLLKFCLLFLFVSYFTVAIRSQTEGWKGIVPLSSTRADVERLIGKPNVNGFYEFEEARVKILYVEARCSSQVRCDCLAPIGTVKNIRLSLNSEVKPDDLGLDLTDYERSEDSHLPGVVSYTNYDRGIIYTVQFGLVTIIQYVPTRDDCERLEKTEAK